MSPRVSLLGTLFLALALGVSGCSKDEKKPSEAKLGVEKPDKPAKRAPVKPKVDEELVALSKVVKTEEDFEENVAKAIGTENLESEVDKLEQELTPQKP